MGKQLTAKRQRFVELYCKYLDGTKAAREAGYSAESAEQRAWALKQDPKVQKAIAERMEEVAMGPDEVLVRLANIARAEVGDFIEIHENGTWTVDLAKAKEAAKLGLIRELGYDRDGNIKFKLHDSHSALRDLARIHGLFVDRHEVSGPEGGPLPLLAALAVVPMEELFQNREQAAAMAIGAPEEEEPLRGGG